MWSKIKKSQILFVILLIVNLGLAAYWLSQKEGWFIDEYWAYAHANSTQGAFLTDEINSHITEMKDDTKLNRRWLDGKIFHDYLTADEQERFSYSHIGDNLKNDVHPPLFYVLLHTICSFTPESYNAWQAGGINLFFFMLTILVFYKLCRLFIKDDYLAMVPVFLWGFSNIGLGSVVLLRMYAMQTFFAVCLLYETGQFLIANELNKRRLILIFLWSTLGILTQYSSLVFSFITAMVGCVVLLYRQNWKMLFYFALVMGLSAVALFVIFPQALEVLLFSSRGQEMMEKKSDFGDLRGLWLALIYSNTHSRIFEIYFKELLGIKVVYDSILFIIVIVIGMIIHQKKIPLEKFFVPMLTVFILMTLYLSFFMPLINEIAFRYFMMLMPVASLIIVYIFFILMKYVKMPYMVMMGVFALLVMWNTFHIGFQYNVYRMPISPQTRFYKPQLENKNILVIGDYLALFENTGLLAKANKVYFSLSDNVAEEDIKKADWVLLLNRTVKINLPANEKGFCLMCPPPRMSINQPWMEYLEFAAPFRSGWDNFDLYKVIKE